MIINKSYHNFTLLIYDVSLRNGLNEEGYGKRNQAEADVAAYKINHFGSRQIDHVRYPEEHSADNNAGNARLLHFYEGQGDEGTVACS